MITLFDFLADCLRVYKTFMWLIVELQLKEIGNKMNILFLRSFVTQKEPA
jgi:hypothetical protein